MIPIGTSVRYGLELDPEAPYGVAIRPAVVVAPAEPPPGEEGDWYTVSVALDHQDGNDGLRDGRLAPDELDNIQPVILVDGEPRPIKRLWIQRRAKVATGPTQSRIW